MSIKDKTEELNLMITKISEDENISLIEKDLLLEKVRELYSLINDLQTIDGKSDLEQRETLVEESSSAPIESTNVEEVKQPEISNESEKVSEIDKVTTERASQFSTSNNNANVATLFDDSELEPSANIEELNTSIHDKMTTQTKDETIVERLKKNPVGDLKKSIGINEKFSFINELFEGNLQNYNDSVEQLNKELSQESAMNKIEEIADTMKWDKNSSTYNKLHSLIERRFK